MTIVRTRSRAGRAALAAVLGMSLAACTASDPAPAPSDGSPPAATGTPTDEPFIPDPSPDLTATPGQDDTADDGDGSPPPFPADTEPDTEDASSGAQLLLTDIRVGRHDGFDRVVFEYSGTGTPGWHVRYVEETIGDPSGLPVSVAGETALEATVMGVRYPEAGEAAFYSGPGRVRVAATEEVTEVVFGSIFEGYQQNFIGIDEDDRLPFRAYLLTDPVRVVVEVRHD